MRLKRIVNVWWPLSLSWLLMGIEMPALSAVMARLPHAEINLAAYGGIVYPFALIVEAPVIMLLSASVALSKDCDSYRKLERFMLALGLAFTGVHVLLAFTPLYDLVMVHVVGVPLEIVEPARIGLRILTPWTFSIAYRRFQQGVLIRYGHSNAVGVGTAVRLAAGGTVLLVGYLVGDIPGVVVGASAQAMGVISEAVYAGLVVRPVLRKQVQAAPKAENLSLRGLLAFYIPLALTSLLSLLWQPIGSAALSRMPDAVASLAAWQVLSGLVFMLRSVGFSYNEVVVALLGEERSYPSLLRFTWLLAGGTTALHLLIASTPLAGLWFRVVSALPPELAALSQVGFWIGVPLTALSVLQSWYQGSLVHSGKTRPIPESMGVFMGVVLVILGAGVSLGSVTGLYVGMTAFALATGCQVAWLWVRSRPVLQAFRVEQGSSSS